MGAADGVFATGKARCFPAKKKLAATAITTIAAPQTRISVLEFDLVGRLGWDGGDVTLATGAEAAA
jgi:hypothetical protein